MMSPIPVGLVGFGVSGRLFHAPFITGNPRLRLTHVVERHGDESRRSYPDVTVVRKLGDLLVGDGPDLIVIATPNASHFELAGRALRAGRHVVVDKPFTATSEEALRLIELAEESGRVLSVYQNRRWDGDFRTVQQIISGGLLGPLIRYEAHFDRYRPAVKVGSWKEQAGPGSGLLYDLGSHLIDQALTLFGMPSAVTAEIRTERDGSAVDDQFDLTMDYPGARVEGLRVRLHASKLVRKPGPRYTIRGTEGSFVKYGVDPQEDSLARGLTPAGDEGWGLEPENHWGLLRAEIDGSEVVHRVPTLPGCYQAFYKNVCDAIQYGRSLAVTGRDGYRTVRIIELAIESARSQRSVSWSEEPSSRMVGPGTP